MEVNQIDSKVLMEILNGFIRSLQDSMETMVFTKVSRVGVYVRKPGDYMKGDVSSLVTLFGELSGTCVISFPRKLAVSLIGKMMMDDSLDDMTDEVQDGIGELSNLVGGGAKGRLATILGTKASLSTPAIVTGVGHTIEHKKGLPCIGCVFEADGQRFFLEIAVYIDKGVKPNPL